MSLSNLRNYNKFFNNSFYAQHIKMSQNYKNTDLLKFLPFYTSEIQKLIKKLQIKKEVIKKPKISNKELSKALNTRKYSTIF